MKKPRSATKLAAVVHHPISPPEMPPVPAISLPKTVVPAAPALPTDAPPTITDEERQGLEGVKEKAELFREFSCGAYLHNVVGDVFKKFAEPGTLQYYRDQLLRDAGNPADPIERMLIEQLALAHHSIAKLHSKAAAAQTPEEANIYSGAASRLLGEFRRTAQCYREFQAPLNAKKITLVAQQNLAAGDQQVAYINGDLGASPCQENNPHIEMTRIEEYANA